MLTVTHAPALADLNHSSQNESQVSDIEISKRVMRIRSGWSLSERVRRRREAETRFARLMETLGVEAA